MNDLPKLPVLDAGTQKVIVFNIKTGEAFVRWPVDAREMLATGDYSSEVPTGQDTPTKDEELGKEVQKPVDPVPHVTAAKEAVEKEHSPGVPLRTSGATPDPKPTKAPKSKKGS